MGNLIVKCKKCGEILVSIRGGHFVSCKCGESFIDRDRGFPNERYRLGGDVEVIETPSEDR